MLGKEYKSKSISKLFLIVSFLSVKDIDQKMKFEHLLEKKTKELGILANSLVYKEKEVLMKYKNKLE